MENFLNRMADKASRTVRHWWLYLITGILSIIAGIVVFCNPIESYITLSIMFGILMLISGIVELVVSTTSRNYFITRSYSIVGGILDLLIGLFLCCYPRITLVVLPVILGVWMMFHSFMIIGFGGDLSAFRLPGSGWTIFGGVMMLVLGLLMVIMPLTVGVAALAFVMLLVPGVAITNSMWELVAGDTYSGLSRMAEAILIATAIALGAAAGLGLGQLI